VFFMNCQDFEMLVLALARNQLLDAFARKQGLTHAEVCVRCATRLTEERALLVAVSAVIDELAEEEAQPRVEAALLTAFRQQVTATASPGVISMPVKTGHWEGRQRWAIAAGILILISVLVIFWQRSRSLDQQRQARSGSPAPATTPGPTTPPLPKPVIDHEQLVAQQPLAPGLHKRVRHRTFRNNSDEAEEVTRFFPLIEGDDLAELENVLLVRVEVPSSALSDVGLRVAPGAANVPVTADVMLGPDGLARAIRFVR
jgi:hypothetical protein